MLKTEVSVWRMMSICMARPEGLEGHARAAEARSLTIDTSLQNCEAIITVLIDLSLVLLIINII